MRILFAYEFCGLGGVETSVLNRCEALRRRGVEATVLFGKFYGDGAVRFADLPHVLVGPEHISSLLRQRFDVVCLIDYPDLVARVMTEAPDSVLFLETHASRTARLLDFHRLADHPAVAAVIVPSLYNRDLVLRVSDGRRPIYCVPNGVDVRRFHTMPSSTLRHRFGPLMARCNVLWVGRLEDEKNPRGFLEISRDLAQVRPDAHFICIGDAPQDPEYRHRLQMQLPVEARGNYQFIQAVPNDDMPMYYSLAGATGGCLVSTSRFESVPMTFLEAMACSCPVVSAHVGGVTEILKDGLTAELFATDDADSALRAIRRLLDLEASNHRHEIVDRARAYVCEHHSLEVTGDCFISALTAVMGGRQDLADHSSGRPNR